MFPQTPSNTLLAILSKLDNIDKHRVLLTSVSAMHANRHGSAYGYQGSAPEPEYFWGALEEGRKVATFRCSKQLADVRVRLRDPP